MQCSLGSFQSTRSLDDWRIYCHYRNRVKKTMRKEGRKYFINTFVGMNPSTMWRKLRRSGFSKGNDSPIGYDVEEMNNQLIGESNCDLPVNSEPWTNLKFNGFFLKLLCIVSGAVCSTSSN